VYNLARKKRGKQLSDYDVGFAILNFLVRLKEDPEEDDMVSAHRITKKAPEFIESTQRQQRIEGILITFEERNQFVNKMKVKNATYWSITDAGYKWFKNIAKKFMEAF